MLVIQVSIVCALGKGPVRGGFPISNYVLQSCDGSRGGILYNCPILYYLLLAINVCL